MNRGDDPRGLREGYSDLFLLIILLRLCMEISTFSQIRTPMDGHAKQ